MRKLKSVIAVVFALVLSFGAITVAFAAEAEKELTIGLEMPEKITVDYGEVIELKAITGELNYEKVKWTFSDDEMFDDESSYIRDLANKLQLVDSGRTFIIKPLKSGTLTVTAAIVDWQTEEPYCVNGTPVSVTKSIEINVLPGVEVCNGAANVTIGYGETKTVYAEGFALPEGAYLKWTANDDRIKLEQSADGTSCEVTKTKCEIASLTVSVVDSRGNPINDKTGEPVEADLEVWTVFSSYGEYLSCKIDEIFSSILDFFRNLF